MLNVPNDISFTFMFPILRLQILMIQKIEIKISLISVTTLLTLGVNLFDNGLKLMKPGKSFVVNNNLNIRFLAKQRHHP